MDNDNFVNLVQAIELKELGFREYCYQHYDAAGTLCDNYINVPTGSMNIITTVNILKSYNNYRNVTDKWDAPTLSQVHAWLRTNKFIDIDIEVGGLRNKKRYYVYSIILPNGDYLSNTNKKFFKYEKGLSDAITKCIEMLK